MDENINYKELLLEMLEKKEYTKLRQTAAEMQTADIAAIMDEMEDEDSLKMFRLFPKDMAADVFADLEPDDQQYIIQSLSHKEASTIIDNLMSDDAADLLEDMLEEMPAKVATCFWVKFWAAIASWTAVQSFACLLICWVSFHPGLSSTSGS